MSFPYYSKWLSKLNYSPCTKHTRRTSMYNLDADWVVSLPPPPPTQHSQPTTQCTTEVLIEWSSPPPPNTKHSTRTLYKRWLSVRAPFLNTTHPIHASMYNWSADWLFTPLLTQHTHSIPQCTVVALTDMLHPPEYRAGLPLTTAFWHWKKPGSTTWVWSGSFGCKPTLIS